MGNWIMLTLVGVGLFALGMSRKAKSEPEQETTTPPRDFPRTNSDLWAAHDAVDWDEQWRRHDEIFGRRSR
jgi:hypothetical protein